MNNIENIYTNYAPIIEEFGVEKVQSKYNTLYNEMEQFLKDYELGDCLRIEEMALTHAVLDYFTDVSRLKKMHNISNINEIKVCAYESYWLLRRHSLQVVSNLSDEEKVVFANEKFVFSRIAKYLMDGNIGDKLNESNRKSILNFFDTLYYHLKFRNYDAQTLEMLIISFQAGKIIGKDSVQS